MIDASFLVCTIQCVYEMTGTTDHKTMLRGVENHTPWKILSADELSRKSRKYLRLTSLDNTCHVLTTKSFVERCFVYQQQAPLSMVTCLNDERRPIIKVFTL